MKRVLSTLLCVMILLGTFLLAPLNANAIGSADEITVGENWVGKWDASTMIKCAYLTVDETGYYDLSVEDLNGTAGLWLRITDLDSDENEDYYFLGEYYFLNLSGTLSSAGIYLIKDHFYELRWDYSWYDEYSEGWIYEAANINVLFSKSSSQSIGLTFGKKVNLVAENGVIDWFEFKTTTAGDYLFETDRYTEDFDIAFYEKSTRAYVGNLDFSSKTVARVNLKANTDYIIECTGTENPSGMLVRFSVSKAAADISKIEIVQKDIVWADSGYIGKDYAFLSWSCVTDDFDYKVTYSDGSAKTFTYYQLFSNGTKITDINYLGKKCEDGDDYLFATGKQQVEILYTNDRKSISYVYITPYVKWLANKNTGVISDYENMSIDYNRDGASGTYYWRIKPDETNNYEFYSTSWKQINSTLTVFDENNNIVPRNDGWNLKGGKEYALRVSYEYYENCYDEVDFDLELNHEHTHSYVKKLVKKATLTANGRIDFVCSSCANSNSYQVISRPKKFTLSATAYNYDGKAKKPAVSITNYSGILLKNGTDYTVTYAAGRKNVGTYKVIVTMKGNYSGTKTLYFKINPPKTTVKSVTGAKNSVKVAITKKTTQVTGYQIQYSTSKNFSGAKTQTVKSAKTTSATIKSLKAKKTYYVRVRTYKTVGGTKYYSSWSAYKSAKTK